MQCALADGILGNPSVWVYTPSDADCAARGRLRIVIYWGDHRPAHFHAIGRGGEAVFNLNCPAGPPALREVYGLSRAEVGRIRRIIASELSVLCADWETMHGEA